MYPTKVVRHALDEIGRVARADTRVHGRFRDHLTTIVFATVVVDLVCAVLALVFEDDAKQTQIKSFGSSLFWTTSQLLTISSSMANPLTTGGRILDVFMEIWAITIVAGLTGAIGSFLVSKGRA